MQTTKVKSTCSKAVCGPSRTTWPPPWLNEAPAAPASTPPEAIDECPFDVEDEAPADVPEAADAEHEDHDAEPFDWFDLMRPADLAYLNRPLPSPCPWCGGHRIHSQACDELRRSWEVELPWGKFKGKCPSEVPDAGYLRWLATRDSLDADIRDAIKVELARRAATRPMPPRDYPRREREAVTPPNTARPKPPSLPSRWRELVVAMD